MEERENDVMLKGAWLRRVCGRGGLAESESKAPSSGSAWERVQWLLTVVLAGMSSDFDEEHNGVFRF